MRFPDHPFWDFSLATYGREGVADACLALQEAHGADVNILLFCAWAGGNGVRLGRARIGAVCGAVREWHSGVVRPLRAVRRRLKTALDGAPPGDLQPVLRARLQKIEIDAEHIEQLRLAALADFSEAGGGAPDRAAARANMADYLAMLGAGAGPETDAETAAATDAATDAALAAIAEAACDDAAAR